MPDHVKTKTTLDPDDEIALVWYFGVGITRFERSNLQAQLDQLYLFGVGAKDCPACKGKCFTPVKIVPCGCADGFTKPRTETEVPRPCKLCLKPGEHRGRGYRQVPKESPGGMLWDEPCETCHGSGHVPKAGHKWVPVRDRTVHPKATQQRSPPPDPDFNDLERYGMVVRRLVHMSERAVKTLFAYYLIGHNYAQDETKGGRLWAVQALTPAGKRLLKRHAAKRPSQLVGLSLAHQRTDAGVTGDHRLWADEGEELDDDWAVLTQPERLAELQSIPDTGDNANHKVLMGKAMEQAAGLYALAIEEWEDVARRGPQRRQRKRSEASTQHQRLVDSSRVVGPRLDNIRRHLEVFDVYLTGRANAV